MGMSFKEFAQGGPVNIVYSKGSTLNLKAFEKAAGAELDITEGANNESDVSFSPKP